MFLEKGVLRNFTKLPEKHLYQSLFFNKRDYRCFPVNFVTFLRTPFLQNASGRLLLDLRSCTHAYIIAYKWKNDTELQQLKCTTEPARRAVDELLPISTRRCYCTNYRTNSYEIKTALFEYV